MKNIRSFIAFLLIISVFMVSLACAENAQTVTIGSQQIRLGQTSDEVTKLIDGTWAKKNSNWTSFAGYDGCVFIFSFDKNNILTSVVIVSGMSGSSDRSSALTQFATLNDAYSSKYGSPIATDGKYISYGNSNYTAVQAINEYFFTSRSTGITWYEDPSTSLLKSSQFLVDQGDNTYVDIILMEYDRKSTYTKHNFIRIESQENKEKCGFIISYSLCSEKEVNAIIEDAQNRQNSLNSDI